jgi:hypothetical protein
MYNADNGLDIVNPGEIRELFTSGAKMLYSDLRGATVEVARNSS